jgi:uncharacterized protein (TIGR04255 family)
MNEAGTQVFPKLTKAPIVLAILQIQFQLKEPIENHFFSKLSGFKDDYPTVTSTNSAEVQFNPNDTKTPISLKGYRNDGYNYASVDGLRKFSISNSVFTFQLSPPYESWKDFSNEAIRVWKKCGIENQVNSIIRQSIRYINAFEIIGETSILEPSEYFNSYLVVGDKYPDYTRYFFQYTIPLDSKNQMLSHVSTEIRETTNNIFPIVFDIDVLSLNVIPYELTSMTGVFDKLRDYKNSIFFNSLKEKTISIFK